MLAALRPVQLDDQIGESIDHAWLLIESRRRVDHAKNLSQGGDPIQIAQFALQTGKDGQATRRAATASLLERDLGRRPCERRASDPSAFCGP